MGARKSSTKSRRPARKSPPRNGSNQASRDTLRQAVQFHQAADTPRAISVCHQHLRDQPGDFEAILLVGTLYLEQGDGPSAIQALSQARTIRPNHSTAAHYLALAYHQAGKLDQALPIYEEALRGSSVTAQLYVHAGNAYFQSRRMDRALDCFRQAVAREPNLVEARHQFADTLRILENHDEAVQAYRDVLKINPSYFPSRNNLGLLLMKLGRYEEGMAEFSTAARLDPSAAEPPANLAVCLAQSGRLNEAMAVATKATQQFPHQPLVHESLAKVNRSMGRKTHAEEAMREALRLQPASNDRALCLAQWLLVDERYADARKLFQTVLDRSPNDESAAIGLAQTFEREERIAEARSTYCSLADRHNSSILGTFRAALCCPTLFEEDRQIDAYRVELDQAIETLRDAGLRASPEQLARLGIMPPFNLQFHDRDDRPIREQFGQAIADMLDDVEPSTLRSTSNGRPKVGFVTLSNHSAFLRSMGRSLVEIASPALEIVVFAPVEGQALIERSCQGEHVSCRALSSALPSMAKSIRDADLDAIVYFEIGTLPAGYILAHHRLAPVQITTWGIQGTSGIPTIDEYVSSSRLEPEDADAHYTERLIRFRSFITAQERRGLAAIAEDRSCWNLPESARVYYCPQQLGKFTPGFIEVIAEILRRDPDGHLMVTRGNRPAVASQLEAIWQRKVPDVAPRMHVIDQQKGEAYWRRLKSADVLLDPTTFSGVNTTYDALAVGQPIVTLPSRFQRGRHTAGCFQFLGIDGCIARSREDYIACAVRLAGDANWREELRRQVVDRSPSLFDQRPVAREWREYLLEVASGPRKGA